MGGIKTNAYGSDGHHTIRFGNRCTAPCAAGKVVGPENPDMKLAHFVNRDDVIPGFATLAVSGNSVIPRLSPSKLHKSFAGREGKSKYPLSFHSNHTETLV